jgi:hypothetical protein
MIVLCRYYGIVQMLSMRPLMIFMSESSPGEYKALHKQVYNDDYGHLNNAGKGAPDWLDTKGNSATARLAASGLLHDAALLPKWGRQPRC